MPQGVDRMRKTVPAMTVRPLIFALRGNLKLKPKKGSMVHRVLLLRSPLILSTEYFFVEPGDSYFVANIFKSHGIHVRTTCDFDFIFDKPSPNKHNKL